MKFHRCPICHSVGSIILGELPSVEPHSYFNRCAGKAITGNPGTLGTHIYKFKDSWRGVDTSAQKLCGFPMTDQNGLEILDTFTTQEYVEFTRDAFSVDELISLVMAAHQKTLPALTT